MVAALGCVRPQFQWYQLAYATEIKSIQLHDSRQGKAQPKDSIIYITSHCITMICIWKHIRNPGQDKDFRLTDHIIQSYIGPIQACKQFFGALLHREQGHDM